MYKHLRLAFLFLCVQALVPSLHAQGVSMSPTRLFFTGNPGEEVKQTVVIHNGSDNNYIFNINVQDWNRTEDGTKIYFAPSTLKNSNAAWISTLERSINLPSKTTQEVVVTMRIPADGTASMSTNSMLFFTQIGTQTDAPKLSKGIGIIALFEFGLHIYYTPLNSPKVSLEIKSIETVLNREEQVQYAHIRLYNDGNGVNDASIDLELTNKNSGEEVKLPPVNLSMMPGTYQTILIKLPTELKGPHLGVFIIKMAGSNDLVVGEKSFEF